MKQVICDKCKREKTFTLREGGRALIPVQKMMK